MITVRLTIGRTGTLQDCEIHFEVVQEYSSGARGDHIRLGRLALNLAEYADSTEEGNEGIVRRYLMQDSKINSTLKVRSII